MTVKEVLENYKVPCGVCGEVILPNYIQIDIIDEMPTQKKLRISYFQSRKEYGK